MFEKYSEIKFDNRTLKVYFLGAAQEIAADLKKNEIPFVWYYNGKLQL